MPFSISTKHLGAIGLAAISLSLSGFPAASGDWSQYFTRGDTDIVVTRLFSDRDPARQDIQIQADRRFGNLLIGGALRQGNLATGASQILRGNTASAPNSVQIRAGYSFGHRTDHGLGRAGGQGVGQGIGYVSFGTQGLDGREGGASVESLGLGLQVSLNNVLRLTGEYLHFRSDDAAGNPRRETNSLALRAAFRF